MDTVLSVCPRELTLDNVVYGSDIKLHRNFNVENKSKHTLSVTIEPDEAFSELISQMCLCDNGVGTDENQQESNPANVNCFASEGAGHGDENFMERQFHDSCNPKRLNVLLPSCAECNVTLSVVPAHCAPKSQRNLSSSESDSEDDETQFRLHEIVGRLRVTYSVRSQNSSDDSTRIASGSFEVPVKFLGCESHIFVDSNELHFGACEPGKQYVKDITIRNRSEIDTAFRISHSGTSSGEGLEFVDYETGRRIQRGIIPLLAYRYYQLRLSFSSPTTRLEDDGVWWFAVENILNASNVSYVKVTKFLSSRTDLQYLEILSNERLNFGDCYAWKSKDHDVVLKNTSREPIRLLLSSSIPDQVHFELVSVQDERDDTETQNSSAPISKATFEAASFAASSTKKEYSVFQLEDERRLPELRGRAKSAQYSAHGTSVSRRHRSNSDDNLVSESKAPSGSTGQVRQQRSEFGRVTKTDKLDIDKDQARHLRVWYTPAGPSAKSDISSLPVGRLSRREFQIMFRHVSGGMRVLPAESRVCESLINVSTHDLDLGDCDVLTSYPVSITVYNMCDLPAKVSARCHSKCVSLSTEEFEVGARQSRDYSLTYTPRMLNPDYVKQVSFTNRSNCKQQEIIVTIRANNVDQRCISLHALFYKVLDPEPTNEINFGSMVPSYPAIRAFRLQNVTDKDLVLGLDPSDFALTFVPSWNLMDTDVEDRGFRQNTDMSDSKESRNDDLFSGDEGSSESRDTRLKSLSRSSSRSTTSARPLSSDMFGRSRSAEVDFSRDVYSLLDLEDIQNVMKTGLETDTDSKVKPNVQPDVADSLHLYGFSSILRSLRPVDSTFVEQNEKLSSDASHLTRLGSHLRPAYTADDRVAISKSWTSTEFSPQSLDSEVFLSTEEESEYAEKILRPGDALKTALSNHSLVRANKIMLRGREDAVICVAIIVSDEAFERHAKELSLFVRLIKFDTRRIESRVRASMWRGPMFSEATLDDLPPRELILSVQILKAKFDIRPLHCFNFGAITAGTQRHRHFVIDNSKSSASLLFTVQKSRSVASSDVRVGNGYDSGRLGVVRPFATSTIPFVFRPSFPGPFLEKISILNILDENSKAALTIKADVQRRSVFHLVAHTQTDFGIVHSGVESSHSLRLDIYNDSEKSRKFTVSVVDRTRGQGLTAQPKVLIYLVDAKDESMSSLGVFDPSTAKEIEAKEQKLQIYEKKGKAAKAEILRKEIASLRSRASTMSFSSDSADHAYRAGNMHASTNIFEEHGTFDINPAQFQRIEVRLLARLKRTLTQSVSTSFEESCHRSMTGKHVRTRTDMPQILDRLDRFALGPTSRFSFTLGIYEAKDRDSCHSINCSAEIATPMKRSESSLSASEIIIPADDNDELLSGDDYSNSAGAGDDSGRFTCMPDDELPQIDFGHVRLGVSASRPVQVRNMAATRTAFEAWSPERSGRVSCKDRLDEHGSPLSSIVKVIGLTEPIDPGQQITFFIAFVPLTVGDHSRMLILKPKENEEDIAEHQIILKASCSSSDVCRIESNADSSLDHLFQAPRWVSLRAQDLSGKRDESNSVFLGFGFVDEAFKYAIVRKAIVTSEVDLELDVSIQSNLTHQVLLYADESLSTPLVCLKLQPRDFAALWIAIAPRVRPTDACHDLAREMVGGLHVVARHQNCLVSNSVTRFAAVVASSPVRVTPLLVNLGYHLAAKENELILHGSFTLENTSSNVRARYVLELSSSSIAVVDQAQGILALKQQPQGEGKRAHVAEIHFSLHVSGHGLVSESIYVRNLNCPGLSKCVRIRAFIDAGIFSCSLTTPHSGEASHTIYIASNNQGWYNTVGGRLLWRIWPTNVTKPNLDAFIPVTTAPYSVCISQGSLVTESTVDAVLKTQEEDLNCSSDSDCFVACGPPISFKNGSEMELHVVPSVSSIFSESDESDLRAGKFVDASGVLALCRVPCASEVISRPCLSKSLVLFQEVSAKYCYSRLAFVKHDGSVSSSELCVNELVSDRDPSQAEDQSIDSFGESGRCTLLVTDLGNFGHCKGWCTEIASAWIRNCAVAPLCFSLEGLPAGFILDNVTGSGVHRRHEDSHQDGEEYSLDPFADARIRVRVIPEDLLVTAVVGNETVEGCVIIDNSMNPGESLSWIIRGTLTRPRLQFDGLDDSQSELPCEQVPAQPSSFCRKPTNSVLLLPEISFPGARASSASFGVRNISDYDTTVKVTVLPLKKSGEDRVQLLLQSLLTVTVSESSSGVELHEFPLGANEAMGVRVTADLNACAGNDLNLTELLRENRYVQETVCHVEFECVHADVAEPAGSVEVSVLCKHSGAITTNTKEILVRQCFPRSKLKELVRNIQRQSDDDVVINQLQVLRLSNELCQSERKFNATVVDCPSGSMPFIYPSHGAIEPYHSVELYIGFAYGSEDRGALFGVASLQIFDVTSRPDGQILPNDEPAVVIPVHFDVAKEFDVHLSSEKAQSIDQDLDDRNIVEYPGQMSYSGRSSDYEEDVTAPSRTVGRQADEILTYSSHKSRPVESVTDLADQENLASGQVPRFLEFVQENEMPRSTSDAVDMDVDCAGSSSSLSRGTSFDIGSEQKSKSGGGAFVLKGCAWVADDPHRYELDCGQFLVDSEPFTRKVSIENRSNYKLEYQCARSMHWSSDMSQSTSGMMSSEDFWLRLSRSGGSLKPCGQKGDKQILSLTLNRDHIGLYTTYLVFESTDDNVIRTVKVNMEVVADGMDPSVPRSFFSVFCDGRGTNLHLIDYSTVMLGQLYRHRSFVVQNECDVTLEFVLSSDLPDSSMSELSFSMTNALLRNTSRLVVPPGEKQRVFLLYRPLLESGEHFGASTALERSFNVHVTCRLIKDYQLTIKILSKCRQPSLSLSRSEILFDCAAFVHDALIVGQPPRAALSQANESSVSDPPVGKDLVFGSSKCTAESSERDACSEMGMVGDSGQTSSRDTSSSLKTPGQASQPECDILVRKTAGVRVVRYTVMNNTQFFEVCAQGSDDTHVMENEQGCHTLAVRPDFWKIAQHASFLSREKYVEEHITIYNRDFPREFFWVRIRLIVGGATSEFSSVSHKRAFSFSKLENLIVRFLTRFAEFWAQFRRRKHVNASSASSESDSAAESLENAADRSGQSIFSGSDAEENLDVWVQRVAAAPLNENYDAVLFELHYATDELVYYKLKSASKPGLQLAYLLYSFVFKHEVFTNFLLPEGLQLRVPEMMISWVGQLRHFLSFFPDKRHDFRGLTELEEKLKTRMA